MTEELGDIAQAIRLVTMNCVVVLGEGLLEKVEPKSVELRKSFSNESKEFGVCLFLRAALDNHRRQFGFLTRW